MAEWTINREATRAIGIPSPELDDPERSAMVNVTQLPDGTTTVSLSLRLAMDEAGAKLFGERLLGQNRDYAVPTSFAPRQHARPVDPISSAILAAPPNGLMFGTIAALRSPHEHTWETWRIDDNGRHHTKRVCLAHELPVVKEVDRESVMDALYDLRARILEVGSDGALACIGEALTELER